MEEAAPAELIEGQRDEAIDSIEPLETLETGRPEAEPIPIDTIAELLGGVNPKRPRPRAAGGEPGAARGTRKTAPRKTAARRTARARKAPRIEASDEVES